MEDLWEEVIGTRESQLELVMIAAQQGCSEVHQVLYFRLLKDDVEKWSNVRLWTDARA